MTATTGVNIETQQGIREYILDKVSKLDPYQTPLLALAGKEIVTNSTVNWTEQTLATPSAANKNVHGFSTSFALADHTVRSKKTNYTQLMDKPVKVDKSLEAMKSAGVPKGGELAYQKGLKLQELMNDVECMAVSANTAVAPLPESNTDGVSAGVQTYVTTNKITAGQVGGDYPQNYLDQPMLDDLLGKIKKAGGRIDKFLGGVQAVRAVAGLVQQVTRQVGDDGKKITNIIKQYDGIAGLMDIIYEPNLTNVILLLESARIAMAYLREPEWEPYPDGIVDGKGGIYKTEVSVMVLSEKACGKITGLGYTI